MTIDGRLAKLEAGHSPTQLVVRWLTEIHGFDDHDAFARSLIDQPPAAFPMDRLAREAAESARGRNKGMPRSEIEAAVRKAVIEACFRVSLVFRIGVMGAEFLDREGLVQGVISAHLALILDRCHPEPESDRLRRLAQMRDVLFRRINELHAFEIARANVESRYLGGMAADFPAAQRAWAEQRLRSETMTVTAMRIAELDGLEDRPPDDQEAFDDRIAVLEADFVEPARSHAYDTLGDGHRAMAIAVRWLRPKLLEEPVMSRR